MRSPTAIGDRSRARGLRRLSTVSRVLVVGAAALTVTAVVSGPDGAGARDHDADGHQHVTAGPDVRNLAADPTLPRTGWTAVADSLESGYGAGAVLDGNANSIWHTQYSGTIAPMPHTLTIDMHAMNTVSGLRYQPRLGANRGGSIGQFEVRVSTDGTTWGKPVATGTFADDAEEKSVPIPATSGRFVRLTALTEAGGRGQWSSAAEINLNGNAAPVLPRTGWTAAADSAQPGYPVGNVLDGNVGTIWHTPYGPGATALPHTVIVDMKATNLVSGLRYLPRTDVDNRGGTIGGYQVHLSADGVNWGTAVATGTFADDPSEKSVPFTPAPARYIRLSSTTEAGNRGPWTTVAELNVAGFAAPTLERSGWTVTADSQENRTAGNLANNVLDGDLGTAWQTKYVGAVAPLPHTITIDTHATNVISGLRYQPRIDANRSGTVGGYQVHVSNDGVSWGVPVASGTWGDSPVEKVAAFAPQTARYVRLTALTEAGNRGPWSSAAEINLTGDLPRFDPHTGGSWGATVGFPIIPVAVSVLPNGKLLTWAASNPYTSEPVSTGVTQTATMNLADGTVSARTVSNTGHDMFCPGTAALPDGRILVAGGSNAARTSIYDPASDSWTSGQNMNIPRGYESTVTLSDGRVFTIGGSWNGGFGGKNGEVWSQATGWRTLPGAPVGPILTNDPEGAYRSDNHPWLFAMPGGRVFQAGPSRTMNWFDANGSGSTTPAGPRGDDQDAMNGDAAMYDVGKILTSGGAPGYGNSNATDRAYVIDVNNGVSVTKVAPMNYRRAFHNSVVMPDGKVVVIGGETYALAYSDTTSILPAEIWDPKTNSFTVAASMSVPRNYHSVAVLLPDGRIFSGGGGLCGTCGTNHPNAQIFTPPYLYAADGSLAPRPAITNAPSTFAVGADINVSTDRSVSAFSLVRMGAVTHSINTDQRRIPLTATAVNGTSYTLAVPGDPGVVVPGYYMLFALDSKGVPSVAATVRIS